MKEAKRKIMTTKCFVNVVEKWRLYNHPSMPIFTLTLDWRNWRNMVKNAPVSSATVQVSADSRAQSDASSLNQFLACVFLKDAYSWPVKMSFTTTNSSPWSVDGAFFVTFETTSQNRHASFHFMICGNFAIYTRMSFDALVNVGVLASDLRICYSWYGIVVIRNPTIIRYHRWMLPVCNKRDKDSLEIILDAWNGFNSVPLRESNWYLTTRACMVGGVVQEHHRSTARLLIIGWWIQSTSSSWISNGVHDVILRNVLQSISGKLFNCLHD